MDTIGAALDDSFGFGNRSWVDHDATMKFMDTTNTTVDGVDTEPFTERAIPSFLNEGRQAREERAIEQFLERERAGRGAQRSIVERMFDTDEWKQHYEYNDHTGRIEAKYNFSVNRVQLRPVVRSRGSHRRVQFQEHVRLKYHPETHLKQRAMTMAHQYDDFRRVHEHAQQAQVGEYISLNILPAMLYITIRKGVQIEALRILCRQIASHCQGQRTRILLKRSPKSKKFSYREWLSAKQMAKLDEKGLLVHFLNKSADRQKTLQLIVRQNIAQGKIQELWSEKHSLL